MSSKKRRKKSIQTEDKNELIHMSDDEGDNLLHLAVVANIDPQILTNICRFMSQKYGYHGINCPNNLLQTPLHIASCIGDQNFVKILIEFGADISSVDRNVENAIHLAVKYGNKKCLELLLDKCKTNQTILDALNINGLSSLHMCVQSGHQSAQQMIQLIVDSGADINIRDGLSGRTPLLTSLIFNRKENTSLTKVLISLNADIYQSDYSGLKPIDIMQENDILFK